MNRTVCFKENLVHNIRNLTIEILSCFQKITSFRYIHWIFRSYDFIDCSWFNVQRQLFHTYSRREHVQRYTEMSGNNAPTSLTKYTSRILTSKQPCTLQTRPLLWSMMFNLKKYQPQL